MKSAALLALLVAVAWTWSPSQAFRPPINSAGSFGRTPSPDGSPLLSGWSLAEQKSALNMSNISRGGARAKPITKRRSVDWSALLKYGVSVSVQLSLIFGVFSVLDKVAATFSIQVPFALNIALFYFFNAKTGIFSPLKQCRDMGKRGEGFGKNQVRPSWTPPGWVFAIMWPIFVFGTRATTASMIVDFNSGRYATATLMSLFAHLAFGNLWNTV